MKIQIDTNDCTYKATLDIDGQILSFGFKKGAWSWEVLHFSQIIRDYELQVCVEGQYIFFGL